MTILLYFQKVLKELSGPELLVEMSNTGALNEQVILTATCADFGATHQ